MIDEKNNPKAMEQAARAIHESYNGAGSWSSASTEQRSHARQCVRLMFAALAKNGLTLSAGDATADQASAETPAPAKAPTAPTRAPPRPPPRRF